MLYRNGQPHIGGVVDDERAVAASMAMGAPVTAAEAVAALRAVGVEPPAELLQRATAEGARPQTAPTGGAFLNRRADASSTPAARNQQSACSLAAQAIARNSPAAGGLMQTCGQLRGENVAAGRLVVDAAPVDATLRVALATAGRAIIAREPRLAGAAQQSGNERAFAIGVAAARGSNPQYVSAIRASMSAADTPGFDRGVQAGAPTQQAGNGADGEGGIPRAVLIGGGVIGVLAIAAAAYKFTR